MHDKHFRELWQMRFQKIFDLEKESFLFYRSLLENNASLLEGTRTKSILEQVMRDEVNHARIARELLRLVRQRKIKD